MKPLMLMFAGLILMWPQSAKTIARWMIVAVLTDVIATAAFKLYFGY